MVEYQVTLLDKSGKYKPVSCLIKSEEKELTKEYKKELVRKGQIKICQKRYWGGKDLLKYGYTVAKVRKYEPEKFKAEAIARYEAIKEAHYADGSWQRPKNK